MLRSKPLVASRAAPSRGMGSAPGKTTESQHSWADNAPDPLPAFSTPDRCALPGHDDRLPIGRDRSMALMQTLAVGAVIAVVTQRDKAIDKTRGRGPALHRHVRRVQDIRRVNDRTFASCSRARPLPARRARSQRSILLASGTSPRSQHGRTEASHRARAADHVRELVNQGGGRANTVAAPRTARASSPMSSRRPEPRHRKGGQVPARST